MVLFVAFKTMPWYRSDSLTTLPLSRRPRKCAVLLPSASVDVIQYLLVTFDGPSWWMRHGRMFTAQTSSVDCLEIASMLEIEDVCNALQAMC